jgi:hypothetical protein
MKPYSPIIAQLIALTFVIALSDIPQSCGPSKAAYVSLCSAVTEAAGSNTEWHLAVYMDINACLSCCEDMSAWIELEEKLPQCGGSLSLWAPRKDSMDVAVAMRLEGLKTPVRVLTADMIEALKWEKARTPIKVLFDNRCQPVKIQNPPSGRIESRRAVEQMLARMCPSG